MAAVGVDGCKAGWVAVVLRDGRDAEAHYLTSIEALSIAVPDAEVIGIDIPIGLPEAAPREADVAARAFVGARRSSVFFTPVRAAIEAATHAEATAAAVQATGMGVSRQSYALAKKILEVERWLPSAPCPVHEVHPEVSFAILLQGAAKASKKSWAGMLERRAGLEAAGVVLDGVGDLVASRASVDDMLDAGVAAWTACRLMQHLARSFPDHPPVGLGRPVAIWA